MSLTYGHVAHELHKQEDIYLPNCKAIALNTGPHGFLLIVAKWTGTKLAAQTAASSHGRRVFGILAQPLLATCHQAIPEY